MQRSDEHYEWSGSYIARCLSLQVSTGMSEVEVEISYSTGVHVETLSIDAGGYMLYIVYMNICIYVYIYIYNMYICIYI